MPVSSALLALALPPAAHIPQIALVSHLYLPPPHPSKVILLAYAAARKTGVIADNAPLLEMFDTFETRFWLPEHGLYADEVR